MGKDIHDRKAQLDFLRLRMKQIDQLITFMQPETANGKDLERILIELEKTLDKGRKFRPDWE